MIINVIGCILMFLAINLLTTLFSRGVGEMGHTTFAKAYLFSCVWFLVILACVGVLIGIGLMIIH